ncbi:MAG: NAD(P)/FAD-dependent oxidoreductase [Acidobacteriota bacterium]|nr:NAD(P)/FAD-dependent oxidoreductase [Acidobacteriota bacterium]
MNTHLRAGMIGAVAGCAGSLVLLIGVTKNPAIVLLGGVIGAAYSLAFRSMPEGYVGGCMRAAALGTPLWVLLSIVLFPMLDGTGPQWTRAGMQHKLPALGGWILYGAALGFLAEAISALATWRLGPVAVEKPVEVEPKQILILGGGFAGMYTAQYLERLFGPDRSVTFTLVSDTSALLFTPMLSEVAGGSLEPSHISSPLRSALRRTEVIRGRAEKIDLERHCVSIACAEGSSNGHPRELRYDHLILALGSRANYMGIEGVEKSALNFKRLIDAIGIRNHVIGAFESADREPPGPERSQLLTFVVAGGGFAGAELAGALNDFARGIAADYSNLRPDEIKIVLVHSRDRILPELSDSLAEYAQKRLSERGVCFELNAHVSGFRPGVILLEGGKEIAAQTLVWTAGTKPCTLLDAHAVEHDKRGAVIVDGTLAVLGRPGVWALGDCAAITDTRSGKLYPPTAQFAQRQSRTLAANIQASLRGSPPQEFQFDSLGSFCVVGYHTACAELTIPFFRHKSVRFSGLPAWFLWRTVYLLKLPGVERKLRVVVDWTMELFFPRDIAQTIDLR